MKTVKITKSHKTQETTTLKLDDSGYLGIIPELDIQFILSTPQRYGDITTYGVSLFYDNHWIQTDWVAETDHSVGRNGYHTASIWNGSYLRTSTEDIRFSVAKLIFNVY